MLKCWRVKGNLSTFLIMWLLSSQDSGGDHQEIFYVRNSFHFCIYLFFPNCLTSFFFRFASEHRKGVAVSMSYRSREKGPSQKPNLCLHVASKLSRKKKKIRTEKINRQIIFISVKAVKAFKIYVPRFLKRCPQRKFSA